MAMDFFESQDDARKKTWRLVCLFVLAVIAIMASVYLVVAGVIAYTGARSSSSQATDWSILSDPRLLAAVIGGTILVVGLGTLYKIAQLRAGGSAIAEGLGGRLITADTADYDERKALNVVEEMAIASGMPVPPVYLLDKERGINAFAAGYSPDDAVIGVTRGCVTHLTRDQLQGVIAHEFSHILNGDMRTNIRLIGVLHGILIIGIIGYYVMCSVAYSGHRRSRSGKGGGAAPILMIGGGLMLVGFLGTFFGNLIKAAVSRQREFLADASAVQFTRNPGGIAGALQRIGGLTRGATIESPNAPEASHMFFGQAITSGFNSLFATHPPLPKRILRIDPSWEGPFAEVKDDLADAVARKTPGEEGTKGRTAVAGFASSPALLAGGNAVSQIGRPTEAHLQYAAQLVQGLPEPLKAAAHEPYGARALIYALLINKEVQPRRIQLERLAQHADPGVNRETKKLLPIVERVDDKVRLPLIDMAIPALRALSPAQYDAFKHNVVELVKADEKMDLFEWTLQRLLLRHLEPQFRKVDPPRIQYYSLNRLQSQCALLLSTLAYVGHADEDQALHAFGQGLKNLPIPRTGIHPKDQCGFDALDKALDVLAGVTPQLKRKMLTACSECICADKEVTVHEAELLRAISDSLGCPMPPLLPGQPLI